MTNYLENIPDELIEKIFKYVHKDIYSLVMTELQAVYIDNYVKKFIDDVINSAIQNVHN